MKKTLMLVGLAGLTLSMTACKVEKKQDAKLPEVHATGGQLPSYDVKTPDVNVGTEKKTVEVPKVTVTPADKK